VFRPQLLNNKYTREEEANTVRGQRQGRPGKGGKSSLEGDEVSRWREEGVRTRVARGKGKRIREDVRVDTGSRMMDRSGRIRVGVWKRGGKRAWCRLPRKSVPKENQQKPGYVGQAEGEKGNSTERETIGSNALREGLSAGKPYRGEWTISGVYGCVEGARGRG